MNVDWAPVGSGESLTDRVVEQIEQLIKVRQLRPGDRLPPERELAITLRVSRPSLREAARTLVARGRLSVQQGRGTFVQRPQVEDDLRRALAQEVVGFQHLFDMREVLEIPAAGWAATAVRDGAASDEVVERLHSLLAEAETTAQGDLAALRRLDAEFHMAIVVMAGNTFMMQTIGVLQGMLETGLEVTKTVPGGARASRREHLKIVESIEAGEASAAEAAMRSHLDTARRVALGNLRESPALPHRE